MNEELGQIDGDLKGLFVENKIDEMRELLRGQPVQVISEISDYNWNIIKKYYDTERFDLLFNHFRFVAYTCFMVEYAYEAELMEEESYHRIMKVFHHILELKQTQEKAGC